MNRITIHGTIVRAEIKTAENGTRYFKATLASDRSAKGDGTTDYFPIVAFGEWIDDLAVSTKGDFVGSVAKFAMEDWSPTVAKRLGVNTQGSSLDDLFAEIKG